MNPYILHVLITVVIFSILSLSLNVIVGFAGLISLGHAAFFGIGAYVSAIAMIKGLAFHWAFPLAGLTSALLGLCLALPALRVKDDYLAVVTLGFGVIVMLIFLNLAVTGGPDGLVGIPPAVIFGKQILSKPEFLIFSLVILMIMIWTIYALKHSKTGGAWGAIRDNDVTAMFMGINIYYYKTAAFIVSSFWAGIAGSLYAHYTAYINPYTFGMHTSIIILSMVVLGGIGSITGAMVGAAIIIALPEILRPLADYQDLIYGALLVGMMIFRPQGIMGRIKITEIFGKGK